MISRVRYESKLNELRKCDNFINGNDQKKPKLIEKISFWSQNEHDFSITTQVHNDSKTHHSIYTYNSKLIAHEKKRAKQNLFGVK